MNVENTAVDVHGAFIKVNILIFSSFADVSACCGIIQVRGKHFEYKAEVQASCLSKLLSFIDS